MTIILFIAALITGVAIGLLLSQRRRQQHNKKRQYRAQQNVSNLNKKQNSQQGAYSNIILMLTHELRTPMQAVSAISELLKETNLDSEQKRYVDILQITGQQVLDMANGLLHGLKLNMQGKQYSQGHMVDFQPFLKQCVELIEVQCLLKHIELHTTISIPRSYRLFFDTISVRHILVNLLSNSLKYTEKGAITLSAQLWSNHNQHGTLVIEICDTGIGMSAEAKSKLFNIFSCHHDNDSFQSSTGVGLYITHLLLKQLGGSIQFSNCEAEGTRCTVMIPVEYFPHVANQDIFNWPALMEGEQPLHFVFYANPEIDINEKQTLTQTNLVTINEINTAPELFNHAQKKRVDIVFCDLSIVVEQGATTMRSLKETHPDIILFALSDGSVAGSLEELHQLGVDAILVSPHKAEMIYESALAWVKQPATNN